MKYKILSAVLACTFVISAALPAMAKEPYDGYTYNTYGEKVPAPNAYLPQKVVTGIDLGIGQLNKPADVYVDSNDDIYLLDSGNGRVVILDKKFNLKKVVDKFVLEDTGVESPLKDAAGIFAVPEEGRIYIADKGNQRVAVCDYDGKIDRQITKPDTELLGKEIVFAPRKVVVNSIGTVFILSENINQGMVSIDKNDVFQGFFGAERIQLSAAQMLDLWWRTFLSKEQKAQTATFQPTEYANIFIDDEDFIYTATSLETYEKAQVKRLNPSGTNILYEDMKYGDIAGEFQNGLFTVSAITDVTVDDDGFIFALDRNFGRIYMYDEQSWNLAIFGKKDNMFGTFDEPIAIENVDGKIIVVDNTKAQLVVFEPTTYGHYMREAMVYHYKGRYALALPQWNLVQQLNNNYEWAYAGIGRALHMQEEYKGAMYNFKLANNQESYSKSKKKYRTVFMRKYFTVITVSSLVFIIGLYVLIKNRKKISKFIGEKKKGGRSI